MSVRFKFKNDLEHTALPCDGFHISVLDLKRAIVRLKRLGRVTDFDLEVINQQDNKPFESEDQLIAKNSTLIIVRRPLPAGHQKVWEEEKLAPQMNLSGGGTGSTLSFSHSAGDDRSEDDKLSAMMSNSTEMYDQKNWLKLRGRANYPSKFPPATYRCIKCNLPGHWVSECPNTKTGFLGSELKRTTGIPRSFLKPALKDTPGAKINPQGLFMVNELEERAYVEKKIDKPMWENEDSNQTETPKVKIPEDLVCPVCKDLLRDCIMMPECACEMCDECARNALIESEENTCPVCGESKNSPDELIPWRGKRDKVNKFKNSMGAASNLLQRNVHESLQKPTLPDIKLPGQNDFDTVAGLKPSPVYGMSPGMSSTGASPQIDPMESEGPVPGFDTETKSPGTPLETERTSPSQTPNITNAISSENVAIEGTPASTSPSAQDPVGRSASRSPRRRRSPSQTPVEEQPKSRAVPLPDTSLPPPGFELPSSTAVPALYPVQGAHYSSAPGYHGQSQYPYPSRHGHGMHHRGRGGGRIEKENGYIVDPLAAFEAIMERKDRQKGRLRNSPRSYSPPGRYGGSARSSHRYPRRPPSPPAHYRRPHSPGYGSRPRSPYNGRSPPRSRSPGRRSPVSPRSPHRELLKRSPRGPRTPPPLMNPGNTPPAPGTRSPRSPSMGAVPDGPRTPPPPHPPHRLPSRDRQFSPERRVSREPLRPPSPHDRTRSPRGVDSYKRTYDPRDRRHPRHRERHNDPKVAPRHRSPLERGEPKRSGRDHDEPRHASSRPRRSQSHDNRTPSLSPEPEHDLGYRQHIPEHLREDRRYEHSSSHRRQERPRDERFRDERGGRRHHFPDDRDLRDFPRARADMLEADRRFEVDRHRSARMPEPLRSHERDDRERRYEEPIRENSRDRRDHSKMPGRSDYPSAERVPLAEREHFRHVDEPVPPSEVAKEESEDGDKKRKDRKKRKRKGDSGEETDLENLSKKKKKKTKRVKSKSKEDSDSNKMEDSQPRARGDQDMHTISPKPISPREKLDKLEKLDKSGFNDDQQLPPEKETMSVMISKVEAQSDPISEGELEDKKEDPKSKWDLIHTDDDDGKEDAKSDLRAMLKTRPKNDDKEPPSGPTNEDEEDEDGEDAMTGDKSDEDKSSKKKKKKKKTKKKSKGHHSGSDSDDGTKKKKKKKKEKKYAELKKELMLLRQKIGETHSDRSPSPPAIHDYDNIKVTIARSPSRGQGRREAGRDRPQRSLSPVIASKLMELSGTKILDEPPRRESVKDRLGPIPAKKPDPSSSRSSRAVREGSASRKTRSPERWDTTRHRASSKDREDNSGRKGREEPSLARPHKRPSNDVNSSRSRRETDKSSSKGGKTASPPRRRESPKSTNRSSSKSARNNVGKSRQSPDRQRDEPKSISKSRDKRRDPKVEEAKSSYRERESARKEPDGNGHPSSSPPRESRKNARLERTRSRFEDEASFEPDYEGDSE